MVELGKQGSISIWVGLSLSRIGRKIVQVWRLGHALDENEHIHLNIVVSEIRGSRLPRAGLIYLKELSLEI